MKKLLFIIVLFVGLSSYAQVGVGTSNPDASAQLDVVSTNKGILIPRMKLTGTLDVTTITNPKESLLVYNTATAGDVVPGFYYWNSLKWVTLAGGLSGTVTNGQSFYGTDGSLTGARTVTQGNNDLTFTTGTGKLVVDGTLKKNGAVLSNFVTTTAAAYTALNTANTIVYTGGSDSVFTLPTPSAATAGMEIKIINASADVIYFAPGTIWGGSVPANGFVQIIGGSIGAVFSDGVTWYLG
jgi:hypothetical protein